MKHEERDNLKQEIMDAAWELFHQNGYEKTTVNDIIAKANTTKGGFYYYFKAKDELLNSLYTIFDREYEKFYATMDKSLNCLTQLKLVSQYVAYFIEGNVSPELLAALYQSQLATKSQENFLSKDRYYIKLVEKILSEGQERGEIRNDISVDELSHHVLLLERAVIEDWAIREGSFSLGYFGSRHFDYYIEFMKPNNKR